MNIPDPFFIRHDDYMRRYTYKGQPVRIEATSTGSIYEMAIIVLTEGDEGREVKLVLWSELEQIKP